MIEEWIDIDGAPYYQVSNHGRFRSVTHEIITSSSRQKPHKKLIKEKSLIHSIASRPAMYKLRLAGKNIARIGLLQRPFVQALKKGLLLTIRMELEMITELRIWNGHRLQRTQSTGMNATVEFLSLLVSSVESILPVNQLYQQI